MVATTDLWVYNAENLCESFFLPSYIHFSLTRGKIKKSFFWAYLLLRKEAFFYFLSFASGEQRLKLSSVSTLGSESGSLPRTTCLHCVINFSFTTVLYTIGTIRSQISVVRRSNQRQDPRSWKRAFAGAAGSSCRRGRLKENWRSTLVREFLLATCSTACFPLQIGIHICKMPDSPSSNTFSSSPFSK